MSLLLRRAPLVLPSARISLTGASRVRARCRALPSYHRSWAATQRIRMFASQSPEPPKDEKDGSKPETSDVRTSDQQAKETEKDEKGFVNSPEPTQPLKKSKDGVSKDFFAPTENSKGTKLTQEELKELDEFMERFRKSLPQSMAKDMERTFAEIKEMGANEKTYKVVKEMLDEFRDKNAPLTITRATRITRLAMRLASAHANMAMQEGRKSSERQDKEKTSEEAKEESGKEEKGPRQDEFNKEQKSDPSQPNVKFTEIKFDTGTMITAALTAYLLYRIVVPSENSKEITWQEFRTSFLDKGLVEKLMVINSNRVKVFVHRDAVRSMHPDSPAIQSNFFYTFTIGSVEAFERKLDEAQSELGIPTSEQIPVAYTSEISWSSTLLSMAPLVVLLGAFAWMARRAGGGGGGGGANGIFGMGRSRAKRFNHETDIQIRFKDVAGMDEAKMEIMEFVSFLKEPGQFQRLGAKIPRGAILSGPPGTGKTLLAKATAGESEVPFFSVSGSEFVEMFVGVGASRVRDLFANARKSTPCIIFIDEIDAIGKSRGKQQFGGGNDERESTLNQILTEMDGFNTSEQVVVLAGTNRPDVLDAALLRPGRFDRHISIDRPTMDGRKQIFAVHLRKILTDENMEHLTGRLAALTPGFSGADIANCCNEAALIAARGKADKVRMIHFEQAIERTVGGLEKKSLVLSKEEKRTVAYHEAGHAICGWYFEHADPLLKVSIIPRGQGALGYAQYLPAGDQYLINTSQLLDRMAMTLGGRVSEELHFDTVTSGASDDFKKVTRMATAMVTKWGMSSRIGTLYFEDEGQETLHRPFSEATARAIDAEVRRLVDNAYKQCKDLLMAKKDDIKKVAEALLSQEVLSRDDMVRLLGKRPFADNKEFEKYFSGGPLTPPPDASKSAPPPPPTEGVALYGDGNGLR